MQLDFRDEQTVQLNPGAGKDPLLWTFDRVFHGNASQADIFNLSAKETAEDVIKGYNGTIFAYGQVRTEALGCCDFLFHSKNDFSSFLSSPLTPSLFNIFSFKSLFSLPLTHLYSFRLDLEKATQ